MIIYQTLATATILGIFFYTIKVFMNDSMICRRSESDRSRRFNVFLEQSRIRCICLWRKVPKSIKYVWLLAHKTQTPHVLLHRMTANLDDLTKNRKATQYAAIALMEPAYVDAFSKLCIIWKDEKLKTAFLVNEQQQGHSFNLQQETVVRPLLAGLKAFHERYDTFETVCTQTTANELCLLLQQDFRTLSKVAPLPTTYGKLPHDFIDNE